MAAIAFLVVTALAWGYTSRWTVERVEKVIKKEAPLGSSVESAGAMLTDHHFAHSPYVEGLDSGNLDDRPVRLKGIATGYMVGIKRDVEWSLFIRWDIAVRFYFNERGELVDYTIRKVGTGP